MSGRKRASLRYATLFTGGIGFVANVTAIAGLVTSHARELVIVASLLAICSGLYLFLRKWGKPVDLYVAAAVILLVVGVVSCALAIDGGSGAQDNANTPAKTAQTNTQTQSSGTNSATQQSSTNQDNGTQYTLRQNEGIDLDNNGAILMQQSSATAPSDIYLDSMIGMAPTSRSFYAYQAPEGSTGSMADQLAACANLINTSTLDVIALNARSSQAGDQYCLRTTRGKIFLITVGEMVGGFGTSMDARAEFQAKALQ